MLVLGAALNQHAASVTHVAGAASWVLLVVVVVHDDLALQSRLLNVAVVDALLALLWISAVPSLDLLGLLCSEAGLGKLAREGAAVVVAARGIAHEEIGLASEQDLQPRIEVLGKGTTKVPLELCKDLHQVIGLDVLGSIYADAREANADDVSEVGCDPLLHILALGVEVRQACQPTSIEVQRIRPRAQRSLTVEVQGAVRHCRELLHWLLTGVLAYRVDKVLSVERRGASRKRGRLVGPRGAAR
mmetsp:Transcript_32049/g.92036  ORF Transcript_32049/g.92036 Transcript_32049/m.92036 type:complete len:245 (+) Transcript_32049:428-1162(+)